MEIRTPIKKAPTMPSIEPTAAPISVFNDARRTRISNPMISRPITPPSTADSTLRVPSSVKLWIPNRCVRSKGTKTYPSSTSSPMKAILKMRTSHFIAKKILSQIKVRS